MTITQEPVLNIVITPVEESTLHTEELEVENETVPLPEFVFVDGVIVPLTLNTDEFEPGYTSASDGSVSADPVVVALPPVYPVRLVVAVTAELPPDERPETVN